MKMNYSIGWDVGGWNTRKGDAVWILDNQAVTLGTPRCGNIREMIQDAKTAQGFVERLLSWCEVETIAANALITLAIDAPLAFPGNFTKLLKGKAMNKVFGPAIENSYLFRRTDQYAAAKRKQKKSPLSPLLDRIGSQATKAVHVLCKFGFRHNGRGVWELKQHEGTEIRIIEAYPAMSKKSQTGPVISNHIKKLFKREKSRFRKMKWDQKDALICALTSHLFARCPQKLYPPDPDYFCFKEGWIWFPKSDQASEKGRPAL